MARRTSRRRGGPVRLNRRRRRRSRRTSRRGRRRGVRRNQKLFGADIMASVVVPVIGGTAGFIAARYLGNMLAMRDMGTADPKVGKTIAAVVGIPAVFLASRQMGPGSMLAKNSGAVVLGMGLASAEAWLRDIPLLGGSPAAAAIMTGEAILPGGPPGAEPLIVEGGEGAPSIVGGDTDSSVGSYYETAASGLADYYSEAMLGGLGSDPGNQGHVDGAMNKMEAVSTVIPSDLAMRAQTMPQFQQVDESFVNQGDRGHAGGMFARQLFSGMMGG